MVLARDLHMTRAELRRRMSCAEYTDWVALYNLEARERKKAQDKARRGRRR